LERGLGQFTAGVAKGDILGGIVQGATGLVTGTMSQAAEKASLQQLYDQGKSALDAANRELETADEERAAQLRQFIGDATNRLAMIRGRQEKLADEIAAAQEQGLGGQYATLSRISELEQEGIRAREALTADEEAAARRITAPGGLLERQRQQNALAQAKAMQRARVGGPAARAAIMGQFATQGADLGMQAQRDIMAAQDRARQARAGLLGERTASQVAMQRGLGDLYNRRSGYEVDRLRSRGEADIGFQRGVGGLYEQQRDFQDRMRERAGLRGSAYQQDLGQLNLERTGRELGLSREETQRNSSLLAAAMSSQGGSNLTDMALKAAPMLLGAPPVG